MLIGGGLLAIGLLASSFADALWQVIVLYGVVMTLGANCLGLVVFVPILSRRFVRNRGMAVAVVQSANGFARAFSAPLSQMLIAGLGLARRLPGAGRLHGGGLPAAGRAVPEFGPAHRHHRRAAALPPAGHCAVRCARRISGCCSWSMCSPAWAASWWRCISSRSPSPSASTSSMPPRCWGWARFLSLPGVIVTGSLSDYVGRELSAVVTYGTSIFGVVCAMLITSPDQHLLLWLHSCFFGLTWGARGPAITAKTADLFPGPQLGTILGAITIGTGIGSAAGSWLAGWSFDMTGSYQVAFGLSIFFYACGGVAFWALRRPPAGD